MRSLTIRVSVALFTFTIGIIAAAVWPFDPPRKTESSSAHSQPQRRSEEILRVLLPTDTWADVTQLDRFDHAEEIRVLRDAQVEAKGERAVSIAFLLAVLGDDYMANQKRLSNALQECADKPYPEEAECTAFVADYLMELCRRGDFFLLGPLFDMWKKADGELAESLGGFYSEMLYVHPDRFLKTLSIYTKDKQRNLCAAAAMEDGSGMRRETFLTIHASLNDMFDVSLRPVARTCAQGLEFGYNKAVNTN